MEKLKRYELAKTGTFGANGAEITVQMLREVEETFDGKCPISLGHYMAKQDWWPSWGNVANIMLEVSEDGLSAVLYGDLCINETLQEAIDNGMYPGWSVSIPARAADGKHYLHHLAFLGAVPPKIRDLAIINTADGKVPDNAIAATGEGTDFGDYAFYNAGDFADQTDAAEVQHQEGETPAEGQTSPEAAAAEQTSPEQHPENPAPAAEFSDAQEDPRIAKARKVLRDSRIERLRTEARGMLPIGSENLLDEFSDSIADDSFDFSDEERRGPIEILIDILKAMKKKPVVKPGRMDFSDEVITDQPVDRRAMAARF